MQYKTFSELKISFKQSSNCYTCDGESCHNNTTHKNGEEYNVHISTKDHEYFNIFATTNASTDATNNIDKKSLTELEAVQFICDNFNWFKCF